MSVRADNEHYARVEKYVKEIQKLYLKVADFSAKKAVQLNPKQPVFYFKDYPVLNRQIDKLIGELRNNMTATIQSGISKEWAAANVNSNKIINDTFASNSKKLYSDVSKLPEELFEGIKNYTETTYRFVSRYIRDGVIINETKHQRTLDAISQLDKIFSNTKTVNGTFYRGISLKDDEFSVLMEQLKSGTYTEKSFASMSRDIDVARSFAESYNKVILEVKGNGIDLDGKTFYNEKEVLVNRGIKYKVDDIRVVDGITYVKLSEKLDDVAQSVISDKEYRRLFSNNSKALEAFQNRKIKGLKLSDRVWNYSQQYKTELEQALDVGIADGRSAAQLSRDVREYLREPEKLFRRVRDKNGNLKLSKNALKYNPGAGVYRSSYKNAMRLTRTEINMSYREADHLRWQQMDFVVGIEIRRSNREYACDVCESLKGKYPKNFKFTGWHPHCRCHALSILATEKEFMEGLENQEETKSKNEVEKVPENFNSWMDKNNSRIQRSKNQPYFIKDNKGTITIPPKNLEELMSRASESREEVMKIANELAAKYNGYAVPINLKGKDRILEKVRGELKGEITGIKDAVRTTIILPQKDLKNIIRESEKMSTFVRVRNQTADKFSGYSGFLTNIRTKNGIQGEIQFNTAKMIYAKKKPKDAKFLLGVEKWNAIKKETGMPGGLGHKYYEQMRVLDKAKDASLYKALEKKSINYYKHFR